MDEKNSDTDIASASDDGNNLPGKPVESMNDKEQESPTKEGIDEINGLKETVEEKTCNQSEDSEDKVDSVKELSVGEKEQTEVVPQAVAEPDAVNKDTAENNDEPEEDGTKEVVEQEGENNEVAEQGNESKEVVPQVVARQDDENILTLGEVNEVKELDATENIVRAAKEDGSPKKELAGEISGETKAAGDDDRMKVARDVNEKEIGYNNKDKEGKENKGDVDKEKMNVEQEHKADTSGNESMEVEMNSEEKDMDVKNGLETEQVEGKLKGSSNEEDEEEEEMGSKKRKRKEIALDKTPVSSVSTRPVRERKSVERLVASIEKDDNREIVVEKGPGVALKDIPNVAYKLSKKKNDETFKQLHTILFGRRGKAIQMKNHVSQFSGFVWHGNEEMNKMKVREKFDKLVKEKLIEFCDVLDIPIANKVSTKKEEVVTIIMDFLASPHPTTEELVSDKEHSEKTTKRKRTVGPGSPILGSAKSSTKRRRKTSEKPEESSKHEPSSDGDSDKEEDEAVTGNQGNENGNDKLNQSEDELSENKLSESEDAMDENTTHGGQRLKKIPVKADSPAKRRTKDKALKKPVLNDSKEAKKMDSKNHKRTPNKSSEKTKSARKARTSTDEKKEVKGAPEKESYIKIKNADSKGKPKEEKLKPTDKVLRNQICQILKEVDFNTATFTDILKLLGKHFKIDLTPRKASIKLIIQEELTKMADAADDEEDEEHDVTPEPAKINA